MSEVLPIQPPEDPLSQGAPLPPATADTVLTFQSWYEFDTSSQRWNKIRPTIRSRAPKTTTEQSRLDDLVIVTWNVDAFSDSAEDRISGIMSHVLSFSQAPDVIFLQEVSRSALSFVLKDVRIRTSYFSSEGDFTNWTAFSSFATMTLVSRSRFGYGKSAPGTAILGPVWRAQFPSMFDRDALCCDVFVPSKLTADGEGTGTEPSAPLATTTRCRLVNVHLDSLAYQPSLRPRQLSIATSFLRAAGCGLVAGDFNPVLPGDKSLVNENGLEDAWLKLRPDDQGYTWGIDGKQRFPPNRMDKIAMLGLEAKEMEVMDPEPVDGHVPAPDVGDETWGSDRGFVLRWSDHSGLRCIFGLRHEA